MRYPMHSTASGTAFRIAARTFSSFVRTASGCPAIYSSTDWGAVRFIPSFYVSPGGLSVCPPVLPAYYAFRAGRLLCYAALAFGTIYDQNSNFSPAVIWRVFAGVLPVAGAGPKARGVSTRREAFS